MEEMVGQGKKWEIKKWVERGLGLAKREKDWRREERTRYGGCRRNEEKGKERKGKQSWRLRSG